MDNRIQRSIQKKKEKEKVKKAKVGVLRHWWHSYSVVEWRFQFSSKFMQLIGSMPKTSFFHAVTSLVEAKPKIPVYFLISPMGMGMGIGMSLGMGMGMGVATTSGLIVIWSVLLAWAPLSFSGSSIHFHTATGSPLRGRFIIVSSLLVYLFLLY